MHEIHSFIPDNFSDNIDIRMKVVWLVPSLSACEKNEIIADISAIISIFQTLVLTVLYVMMRISEEYVNF